jgi:hypothetical protein
MRIFPATTIKEFSECEHGEFIEMRVGHGTHLGICIHDEDVNPHLLLLNSPQKELIYSLIKPVVSNEVLSFGIDWVLSPFGKVIKKHEAANNLGAFIQTQEGSFIVAQENGGFEERLLCRLDQRGVLTDLSAARTGFASPHWRIHYLDDLPSTKKKLAANEPVSDGEE